MKIEYKIVTLFRLLTALFFSFLLISIIFHTNIAYNHLEVHFQLLSLLIALFCFGSILFAACKLSKRPSLRIFLDEKKYWILFLGMTFLFLLQILYIIQFYGNVGWDVGVLVETAISENPAEKHSYFSKYTNNLLLLFFFRGIHLIITQLGFTDIWLILSITNILFVNVAIFFIVLIAKKLFGLKGFYVAWLLSSVLLSFTPWLVIPYSDIMSMPFITASFYFLLQTRNSASLKKNIFFYFLSGMITAVGYFIKPSAFLIIPAIIFTYLLFFRRNKREWGSRLFTFTIFILGFLFISISFQLFINKQNMIPIDRTKSIPMTHFMMMGMTKTKRGDGRYLYGAWNQKDVDITMKGKTTDAKRSINKMKISQKLDKYGIVGYLRFLYHKAIWITSDGTFFWGGEGGFMEMKNDGNVFFQYLSPYETFYMTFVYIAQGIWLFLLFFFVISLYVPDKMIGGNVFPIYLIRFLILGIIFFILLFEGRSRYLINYLPFFILASVHGILCVCSRISKFIKNIIKI